MLSDTEEIAEVIQVRPREIQQMKERIAKCFHDPMRPNKEEVANVRQFMTKLSEFLQGGHAFV